MSIKGKGNGIKGVSFQSKKVYNIRQLPEGEVKSGVYIYISRREASRYISSAVLLTLREIVVLVFTKSTG